MSKPIDRDYLLATLKAFEKDILSKNFIGVGEPDENGYTNKDILNKFSLNADGKLLYDGDSIGSGEGSLNLELVTILPTMDISTKTIYLLKLPTNNQETGNIYEEYINLNGTTTGWEKIGGSGSSSTIDLSNYVTNTTKATTNSLGLVKVGSGIDVNDEGIISADVGSSIVENLFQHNISDQIFTVSGITFTLNDDGTIVANGTATDYIEFYIMENFTIHGKYILSGFPDGNSIYKYTYLCRKFYYNSSGELTSDDICSESSCDYVSLDLTSQDFVKLDIFIRITPMTLDNIVFKPMLEVDKGIVHDYVPYSLSRQSLRNDIDSKADAIDGVTYVDFSETEEIETVQITDADRLGGQLPEYYINVDNINTYIANYLATLNNN